MEQEILYKLYQGINNQSKRLLWDGLDLGGRNALIELMVKNALSKPYVIVCENDRRVKELSVHLEKIISLPVLSIYEQSHLPVEVLAKEENEGDRTFALAMLVQKKPCVVVVNVMALMDYYPKPDYFTDGIVSVEVGQIFDQEAFLDKIYNLGYEASSVCDQAGFFAKRGGIVDVYSPNNASPVRIEWFDDEIDSIRYFSSETQKSEENTERVTLIPAQTWFFSPSFKATLEEKIATELAAQKAVYTKEIYEQLTARLGDVGQLESNSAILRYYAYMLSDYQGTFFDYLTAETIICIDGVEMVEDVLQSKMEAILNQLTDLFEFGYILPSKIDQMLTLSQMKTHMGQRHMMLFSEVKTSNPFFDYDEVLYYPVRSNPLKAYPVNQFIEDIKHYMSDAYRVIFYHDDTEVLDLLKNLLREYALSFTEYDDLAAIPKTDLLVVLKANYGFDCEFSSDHCILMNANVFNVQAKKKEGLPKKSKAHQRLIIEDLSVGDYIVHENHGIGMYLGVEHIANGDIEKDYLLVQYKGADRLYVPIDQLHLVEKYVGQEGKKPRINKLGGVEWSKSKSRIKQSIEDMAEQLLEVHAKRQALPGFEFAPDDELQKEFENAFPYVETDDQLKAIAEVKRDMEKPHAMDRLVCGDVGFGKTEVALRAAFKAVCNHKQVAILVPTTILAMQHFETFSKRMEAFGVEIALLTRFCTVKEQNKIFKGIQEHRVDIVIGTHKLLNKKLHFRDLGLLIIDEEQRFGVKHKEQIKSLQENIDVLTLSATPIPRTLYFSLTGVKDMSIIETPPDNRLPIQTYVIEEVPMVIEQAVRREILRGGQVFVVYNSVENLNKMAQKYRELFPNSRILTGHGRMKEAELEDVILKFQNHEADILVCTTIIETGIDMPNVNTMIVHDADHFGMAQLYQLKGRVGRSKRVAYAYLMYKRDKLLSEDQRKRLNALREYTALGSGYKISMRDLEIRGSGNMLGAEQSGHVAEIGFELYLKMLQEAVRKMKQGGDETIDIAAKNICTEIDIDIKAYFPESYISDTRLRIGLYQRLDTVMSETELADLYDELIDRFGVPDEPVNNLLRLMQLKQIASEARILSIKQKKTNVYIKIDPEAEFDLQALMGYVAKSTGKLYLKNIDDSTYVVVDTNKMRKGNKYLDSLKLILVQLKSIVTGENTQYNI
ncbi:MAG: transcription-repair coupling factor [Peptococcaceae bacterium]